MDEELAIGLIASLVGGGVLALLFIKIMHWWLQIPKENDETKNIRAVPSWITGVIERLFFTFLVYFEFSGIPAAMLIWLTLKMVTEWNSPLRKGTDTKDPRLALTALLAGIISLGFAAYGGLIASGEI